MFAKALPVDAPRAPRARTGRLLATVLVGAALAGAALPARAQEDLATTTLPLERWRPALDARGLGTTESGEVPAHLGWDLGLLIGYELNPLVLRDASGAVVAPVVAHRVGGDLAFSLGLFDAFALGVELPLTLLQLGGAVPTEVAEPLGVAGGFSNLGVGDLRLAPKARLLREDRHGVSLAITPALTLPTAGGLNVDAGAWTYGGGFLGEGPGQFAFIPELALSTHVAGVRLAANLAYRLRQPARYLGALDISPELVYRLGAGYDLAAVAPPLGHALLFAEIYGATSDDNPFGLFPATGLDDDEQRLEQIETRLTNALEWLAGMRYRTPLVGLHVEGGIGAGILPGFGSPDLRAFVGVRFAMEDRDRDDDGLEDERDPCPEQAEDKDGHDDTDGCPDPDNDGDGLPDGADACVDEAEDQDGFQDGDGCPEPDNDADGVGDVDDRCPKQPGSATFQGCPPPDRDGDGVADPDDACVDLPGQAELKGCPDQDHDGTLDPDDRCVDVPGRADLKGCKDSDQDGIADPDDRCPSEAEVINGVDDGDGCPDQGKTLVVVAADRIELKETVFFDSGKDTIQKRSFALLEQVALVLKAHAEIKKLSVEGHTDDQGDDARNLDLSKRRAASVVRFLVDKGVDPARLQSEGFGETRPLAPNKTRAGREKNRRVELRIVEP